MTAPLSPLKRKTVYAQYRFTGRKKMPSSPTFVHTNSRWVILSIRVDPVSTRLRYLPGKAQFYTFFFFVALKVPNTSLGTLNTFFKFTDFLTYLGSLKSTHSVLFLHHKALKRSKPMSQTQQFPLFQTPLRLYTLHRQERNYCTIQTQRETPTPATENTPHPLARSLDSARSRARPSPPRGKVKWAHRLWAAGRPRKCSRRLVALS